MGLVKIISTIYTILDCSKEKKMNQTSKITTVFCPIPCSKECGKLVLRDNFNSFNFYRNGDRTLRNQIGWSDVQVKREKNSPSCTQVIHKTLNLYGHFTLLFAEYGTEMYQNVKRTCRVIVFLTKPIFWRRCRCRRGRRCLSSHYLSLP